VKTVKRLSNALLMLVLGLGLPALRAIPAVPDQATLVPTQPTLTTLTRQFACHYHDGRLQGVCRPGHMGCYGCARSQQLQWCLVACHGSQFPMDSASRRLLGGSQY